MHTYTCTHTHTLACTHTCTYNCTHTHTHTCTHPSVYTHAHIYLHTHTLSCTHTCTHNCTHTHTHAHRRNLQTPCHHTYDHPLPTPTLESSPLRGDSVCSVPEDEDTLVYDTQLLSSEASHPVQTSSRLAYGRTIWGAHKHAGSSNPSLERLGQ